jgi:hypothetical protein
MTGNGTLLESHQRYEACPVLNVANSRLGFRALVTRIGGVRGFIHQVFMHPLVAFSQKACRWACRDRDLWGRLHAAVGPCAAP